MKQGESEMVHVHADGVLTSRESLYLRQRRGTTSENKKHIVHADCVASPWIIYKSYSFQWLQFKQQPTGDAIKSKLNNDMAQVALVSALALTIWMSILFGDYSGRTDSTGKPIEQWKLSVLILVLWTGAIFQTLSMINAVFLAMMYGVCVTKTEVEDFDRRLPLATRVPVFQLYIAILTGCAGTLHTNKTLTPLHRRQTPMQSILPCTIVPRMHLRKSHNSPSSLNRTLTVLVAQA